MIELLIAMVIGLLGTIVIFTVYQNAEGFKRTTVSAGDAQTSGALALYAIEQLVRTSGSGITTTNEAQLKGSKSSVQANLLLGCKLVPNPNSATAITTVGAGGETLVAPVRIIDGGELGGGLVGRSDVLVIMGGNADLATNPTVTAPVTGPASVVTFAANLLGWRTAVTAPPAAVRPADIALFTQGGSKGPISNSGCAMRRILSTDTAAASITLAKPLPATVDYKPSTNVHDMGPSPYFVSIGVNAQQQLVATSFVPTLTNEGVEVQRVLADGIVNIQAQYGIDDDLDDVVDAWVEPKGIWSTMWKSAAPVVSPGTPTLGAAAINKIKAIRIAILARSQQYEAPDRTTGLCNSTPTPVPPNWYLLPLSPSEGTGVNKSLQYLRGDDILPVVSLPTASPNGDWRCFRYRRFETIIPIVNMVRSPL